MAINVYYWLRKSPQPSAVLADDKRVEVGKNGRAWRDLAATIKSLEPAKLTALDGQGNILRVVVLEESDAADDKSQQPSPEMTDVQLFAKLLAEAYDRGASKMQPIVDSAMAFVERGGQRLAKAEADNERLRAHIHKLNMQIAELTGAGGGAGDGEDTVVGALLAGAMQAAAGKQPLAMVGVGNGKAAKK